MGDDLLAPVLPAKDGFVAVMGVFTQTSEDRAFWEVGGRHTHVQCKIFDYEFLYSIE